MKTVKVYRLGHDDYVVYILPSKRKAVDQIVSTTAKEWDFVERREVEGGVPLPWPRVEP